MAWAFIRLSWNPNPVAENVTGYKVYENISGVHILQTSVLGTSATIGKVSGTHLYAVSAVNTTGESPLCADVHFP